MHELSIAMNIVEIAEENASREGIGHIDEIILEIGTLSGVVLEALELAMESACKNSVLENAKVTIELITARARCNNCDNTFDTDDIFSPCPECHHPFSTIIKGKELRVKSLKVSNP